MVIDFIGRIENHFSFRKSATSDNSVANESTEEEGEKPPGLETEVDHFREGRDPTGIGLDLGRDNQEHRHLDQASDSVDVQARDTHSRFWVARSNWMDTITRPIGTKPSEPRASKPRASSLWILELPAVKD